VRLTAQPIRSLATRWREPAVRTATFAARITAGLVWLSNTDWKMPPDFGADTGQGLARFTMNGVEHPVLAPFTWLVREVLLPNLGFFGWVILVVETALAASLLAGAFTRTAALVGAGNALVITLTVSRVPGEWAFAYYMMIALHLAVFALDAGTVWGVDALRARRRAGDAGLERAVRSGRATVAGVLAATGVAVVALQADRPALTDANPFSGVHGIQGTVVLGALYLVLAAAVWLTAGRLAARPLGWGLIILALAAVATYGSPVNVVSAAPSTGAILAAAAAFLLASGKR